MDLKMRSRTLSLPCKLALAGIETVVGQRQTEWVGEKQFPISHGRRGLSCAACGEETEGAARTGRASAGQDIAESSQMNSGTVLLGAVTQPVCLSLTFLLSTMVNIITLSP